MLKENLSTELLCSNNVIPVIFFGFLHVQYVFDIRTANSLGKYIDSDNTMCIILARRS